MYDASLHPAARRQRGLTLLELMVVVAIISILLAIALPNYNAYVRRSHRADARAGLLQAQQWLQRAATSGNYPTALPASLNWSSDTKKRYRIIFDQPPSPTTPGYTLKAERKSGPQQADECGDLTLTHTGQQGTTSSAKTVAYCWNR